MNTRNTLLAAVLAAALPVVAQTIPSPGEKNPARVQVVDKATASAQAQSARQGAKTAKSKRKATKKKVKKGDQPAAAKAG
jgi:ABC-type Na+ efflux pump permease subunit